MAFLLWHRGRNNQPARKARLELESLEDRSLLSGYNQLNLTGYQLGMARYTDPNLNGWGLDFAPNGPFCVANNATGVATFYDHSGQPLPQVVTIPPAPSRPPGSLSRPTGVVYNPTSDFVISENGRSAPAEFLFDSRDGTISGWNPAVDPNNAIIMVDNSTETPKPADYTGLVIAQNSQGQNVLYAADFRNNRIDRFGGSFQALGSFTDPNVASQYPGHTTWQVEDVNGRLFVAFAAHKPGPYGGVIDVFDTDGNLLTPTHFAANAPGAGPLENPWGIVQAPANFGAYSNDILIGNVEGAGNINAFDPVTGAYLGQLRHPDGTPIAIPGLWDLAFGAGNKKNGKTNELFFDAGPNVPNPTGNGLFGMIQTKPLTVLNNDDSGLGSLRDALAVASSGDSIAFTPSLARKTITLTSGELAITKNLDIEGLGADQLTISGNAASRVFDISGSVTVTIAGLTISDGLADHGGGILDEAGASLTLSHVTLCGNQAVGGLGGGAIFNDAGASLTVSDSSLTANQATTAVAFDPSTGGAGGGAIFNNFGSSLSVTDSDLSGNAATTTVGFDNFGGAVFNLGGTATIADCKLENNRVSGGGSLTIAAGSNGGAVDNSLGGTLTLTDNLFSGNQAITGSGSDDLFEAGGGAVRNADDSTATISNCRFIGNQAIGGTASGGGGGAIATWDYVGTALTTTVTDCTFIGNQAIGGPDGGFAAGGAIDTGPSFPLTVTGCTFTNNQAVGGDGGVVDNVNAFVGAGFGGAISSDTGGSVFVVQSKFTGNQAIGGNRGSGGNGGGGFYTVDVGVGGAIYNDSASLVISGTTLADNQAIGGSNATGGSSGLGIVGRGAGGGLLNRLGAVATVTDSTFEHNEAVGGSGNTVGSDVPTIGTGMGGGISNAATLTLTDSTLSDNLAIGSSGSSGGILAGDGIGGGLANQLGGTASINDSTIDHNQAVGGQGLAGGNGTDGLGGGIANILGSTLTVGNCTLNSNRAVGGEADDGGNGGNGLGGGIYNDGGTDFGVSSLTIIGSTIAHNKANGGEGDGGSEGEGIGGGLFLAAGGSVCFDVFTQAHVKDNHASTSNDDVFGVFTICP
jgi:uncharacterized protein (TIGR03118 family)